MKSADLVIVGGGMVGLALAANLAESHCQIKIIEKQVPKAPTEAISHRVSSMNMASQQMLEQLGAWQKIPEESLSPYNEMHVWEKDSFAHIHFSHQERSIKSLGLQQLGFIIENQHIHWALWQRVSQQANVEILYDSPKTLGVSESNAFLTLESGEMLSTKLVVGADGAQSWVRNQTKIPLVSQDYQHTALVCNVRTAEPHGKTARQIFSSESILAFLPLADEYLCSIVWSLAPEQAQKLLEMDEKSFNQALTMAFDNQLGLCALQGQRAIYPLTARYSRDFAQPRIALIGDAAHTIHPLAGLGLNLGFGDVRTLASELKFHLAQGNDIGEYRHLRAFERQRKTEAIKVLAAMKGLKELFSGDNPLKKFVRGAGLSLANKNVWVKKFFIEQALGID